jgi:hypothetical protein
MSVFDGYAEDLGHAQGRITGRDQNISAEEELDAWENRTETDPAVQDRLVAYWNNLGQSNWSATETPWSASFVSYLQRNNGFKGDAAHWAYTRDIIAGSPDYPGWSAFNIPWNAYGNGIELNIGDILVRSRPGSNTSGHGEVVYHVDPATGWAYIVGGNLSDSVRSSRIRLMTDETGGYTRKISGGDDAGGYQIILKKDARIGTGESTKKNQMLWILAAGGLAWILLR